MKYANTYYTTILPTYRTIIIANARTQPETIEITDVLHDDFLAGTGIEIYRCRY